ARRPASRRAQSRDRRASASAPSWNRPRTPGDREGPRRCRTPAGRSGRPPRGRSRGAGGWRRRSSDDALQLAAHGVRRFELRPVTDVGKANHVGGRKVLDDAVRHVRARYRIQIAPEEVTWDRRRLQRTYPALGVTLAITDVLDQPVPDQMAVAARH